MQGISYSTTTTTPSNNFRVQRASAATPHPASALLTPLTIPLIFFATLSLIYILASHILNRRKWLALAERNACLSSADVLRIREDNAWDVSPALEDGVGSNRTGALMPASAKDFHVQGDLNPWEDHWYHNAGVIFSGTTGESDAREIRTKADELAIVSPSHSKSLPPALHPQTDTIDPLMSSPKPNFAGTERLSNQSAAGNPWDLHFNDDRSIRHLPAPRPPQEITADLPTSPVGPSDVPADINCQDDNPSFMFPGFKFGCPYSRRHRFMPLPSLKIDTASTSSLSPSSPTPIARRPSADPLFIEAESDDDINDPNDVFHDAVSTPLRTPSSSVTCLLGVDASIHAPEICAPSSTARSFAAADLVNAISLDEDDSMVILIGCLAPNQCTDPEDLPLPDVPFGDSQPLVQPSVTVSPLPSPPSTPSPSLHSCPQQLAANLMRRARPAHLKHRPAWSLRALDAPALGVPASPKKPTPALPESSQPAEPSTPRDECTDPSTPALKPPFAAQPMDFALALQLRPGFGIGAEAAWMVRFLMVMFGWLAMLVSGPGGRVTKSRLSIAM